MKQELKLNPALKSSPFSLAWWRDLPAHAYTPQHATLLRIDLAGQNIPGEIGWRDARNGDAAAAVGIAIRALRNREYALERLDVVMSAVLLATINGDAAARAILIHGLRRQNMVVGDLVVEGWSAAPPIVKAAPLPPERRRKPRFVRPPKWLRWNIEPVSRH